MTPRAYLKTNSGEAVCCEMTLQKAAIRWCGAIKAGCSRTNVGLSNLVRAPSILHGIRSRFSGRCRPSVPLVHKRSRDKDFAVWRSCRQSAACPLRLRAKPLWVLSNESDSLVPYFYWFTFRLCAVYWCTKVETFLVGDFCVGENSEPQILICPRAAIKHASPNLLAQLCHSLTQLLWALEPLKMAVSRVMNLEYSPPFLSRLLQQNNSYRRQGGDRRRYFHFAH